MLIPIETHITCDFPGGSGPLSPPLDPHLPTVLEYIFVHNKMTLVHDEYNVHIMAVEACHNLALVKCIESPRWLKAAVRSKAMVLSVVIYCLMYFSLFVEVLC